MLHCHSIGSKPNYIDICMGLLSITMHKYICVPEVLIFNAYSTLNLLYKFVGFHTIFILIYQHVSLRRPSPSLLPIVTLLNRLPINSAVFRLILKYVLSKNIQAYSIAPVYNHSHTNVNAKWVCLWGRILLSINPDDASCEYMFQAAGCFQVYKKMLTLYARIK
jgi:hypothetical protein